MEIKALLNNQEVEINEGFTIKEVLSEELNTAVVVVPFLNKDYQFEQFDDFIIQIDNEVFSFVVADYQNDLASYDDNLYNYTLSLISETIKLQKIPCPNLAITNSLVESEKRKIRHYLENYHELFISNKYNELINSERILTATENDYCPEMQWNEPTMYEIYNSLLAPIDSIVKVNNHQIDYVDLTEKGMPIDESKIFYTTKNKVINEYVSEIQVETQNAITPYVNTSTMFGITPRNIDQAAITTNDLKIYLDKPIEKINKVIVQCMVTEDGGSSNFILSVDITKRVVEQTVYNSLKLSNSVAYIKGSEYKRGNLFYAQGGKEIDGLSFSEQNIFGLGETPIAIENLIMDIWTSNYPTRIIKFQNDPRDIRFYVEYVTIDNAKFVVKKETKHYAGLIDHQTESYIDADQFGKSEEMTLNRLGNEVKEFTAQYNSISECPKLGDYIGDYILMTREMNIFNDFILFKGTLSKDYVNRDLFYGINSKKRNSQIAMGSDAFLRTDVDNYDCIFSLNNQSGEYIAMEQYLLHGLMISALKIGDTGYDLLDTLNLKLVTMGSILEDGTNIDSAVVIPSTYKVGNQVVVTFKAMDNYSLGMYVDNTIQAGGYGQQYISYVDSKGEAKFIKYAFYESVIPYYNTHPEFNEDGQTGSQINDNQISIAQKYPLVEVGKVIDGTRQALSSSKLVYKDNREISCLSIQFTYKADENIVINDSLIKESPLINFIQKQTTGCFIYVNYGKERYKKGDTKCYGEINIDGGIEIDYSYYVDWLTNNRDTTKRTNFIKLFIKEEYQEQFKLATSWAIGDGSGNLLLGVNKTENQSQISNVVYLNIVKNNL